MTDQINNVLRNICSEMTGISQLNSYILDAAGKKTSEYHHFMPPQILQTYFDSNPHKYIPPYAFEDDLLALCSKNQFDMRFIIVPVQTETLVAYMVLGPFLYTEPTVQWIQDIIYRLNLPVSLHHAFKHYFYSIEVLTEAKVTHLSKCLVRILNHLSYDEDSFRIEINSDYHYTETFPIPEASPFDTKIHIDRIEQRYASENKLYAAVEKGDYKTASSVVYDNHFMFKVLDRVPNNPLRSLKNLFFVYNALLRKAAENGGVHPIYTDSVSGKYAILIEQVRITTDFSSLYSKMLYEYCELVRTQSVKKFSPLVAQVIEYIRLNLDQPFNLDHLAHLLNSSSSTLSRRFKEEQGEAITDYLNRLRIEEAIRLLENKKNSLTQIALKVGYNDINYFTKVFKKMKGMTPSEFKKKMELLG